MYEKHVLCEATGNKASLQRVHLLYTHVAPGVANPASYRTFLLPSFLPSFCACIFFCSFLLCCEMSLRVGGNRLLCSLWLLFLFTTWYLRSHPEGNKICCIRINLKFWWGTVLTSNHSSSINLVRGSIVAIRSLHHQSETWLNMIQTGLNACIKQSTNICNMIRKRYSDLFPHSPKTIYLFAGYNLMASSNWIQTSSTWCLSINLAHHTGLPQNDHFV